VKKIYLTKAEFERLIKDRHTPEGWERLGCAFLTLAQHVAKKYGPDADDAISEGVLDCLVAVNRHYDAAAKFGNAFNYFTSICANAHHRSRKIKSQNDRIAFNFYNLLFQQLEIAQRS